MFEPNNILDPQEQFLEPKGRGAHFKAAIATSAGVLRRNAIAFLWLTGGVFYALTTWVILASDTTEKTLVQSLEQPSQLTKSQPPPNSPGSTPQLQLHPEVGRQATVESDQPAANGVKEASKQEPETKPSISIEAGDPVTDLAAEGGPHAIAEPLPSEIRSAETKESPNAPRERVKVASAANIHSGPSVEDTLLGFAGVGTVGEVASRNGEWTKIVDIGSGKMGWIHSKHLVAVGEEVDQNPSAQTSDLSSGDQPATPVHEQVLPEASERKTSLKSHKKYKKRGWRKKRKRGFKALVRRIF